MKLCTPYAFGKTVAVPFEATEKKVREELQKEGFGILTEIDVTAKFKEKLGKDFRKYVILGACNPPLADRALQVELEIGLLLPCNVIVYEVSADRSVVAALAPLTAFGIVGDNAELEAVAHEADSRLRAALTSLERS